MVQDVTAEMVERHRIEYERDYDVLTNLLNRRAFQRFAQERFEHPEQLKITAFMMMEDVYKRQTPCRIQKFGHY